MHPRLLLALAPLLLAATAASPRAAVRAHPGSAAAASNRPVILVVHGRGHVGRDSAAVRRSAQAALVAGIEARGLPASVMVQDGDVRMVWYADIAGAAAGAAAGAQLAGAAPACGPATDLIGQGSDFALVAGFLGVLLDAAGSLEAAPELRELRADIRYIADPRVQCEAEQRLDAAVKRAHGEGRPVIVVAHSMGALVTWGYLQRRDAASATTPPMIARLVTVGSPLGSPDVRAMVFGESRTSLQLPRGVGGWVNLLDPDDPFAAPIAPSMTGGTGDRARGTDAWTRGGRANPHELEGYLGDPAGAAAIVAAWCDSAARIPQAMKRECGAPR